MMSASRTDDVRHAPPLTPTSRSTHIDMGCESSDRKTVISGCLVSIAVSKCKLLQIWLGVYGLFTREPLGREEPSHKRPARHRDRFLAGTMIVLVLCMAAASGVPSRSDYAANKTPFSYESIRMPDLREQFERLANASDTYVHEEEIRRGDTIASLLKRLEVGDSDAQDYIRKNATTQSLFRLEPGQVVRAEVDQDHLLVSLHATLTGNVSSSRELVIERAPYLDGPAFSAYIHTVKNELRYEMRSGIIADSGFYKTMDKENVPEDVVLQMLSIFSGIVDFHHDIVPGDSFRMVYEAGYRDGGLENNGHIVAVELVNRSQRYQAVWYSADDSHTGAYYTFDGRSMERPFLRSPVEFSRISSAFGWREHPLHHEWQQHKGVDFAAPMGTKVFSTADGTVDFVGQQSGYGKLVILKHQGDYSTYYAHLSGYADIRPGLPVKQGQVIGYVGRSGSATGPHLHYEFRFNDVPQNPLSAMLVEPNTLTGRQRQGFIAHTSDILNRIDVLRSFSVASKDNRTVSRCCASDKA